MVDNISSSCYIIKTYGRHDVLRNKKVKKVVDKQKTL